MIQWEARVNGKLIGVITATNTLMSIDNEGDYVYDVSIHSLDKQVSKKFSVVHEYDNGWLELLKEIVRRAT